MPSFAYGLLLPSQWVFPVIPSDDLISLDEVKLYLRVESSEEDTLITAMMDAAEQQVLQYCTISLVPYGKEATFKVAVLMTVSAMYDNRSGAVEADLPRSARLLINPYRWLRV